MTDVPETDTIVTLSFAVQLTAAWPANPNARAEPDAVPTFLVTTRPRSAGWQHHAQGGRGHCGAGRVCPCRHRAAGARFARSDHLDDQRQVLSNGPAPPLDARAVAGGVSHPVQAAAR